MLEGTATLTSHQNAGARAYVIKMGFFGWRQLQGYPVITRLRAVRSPGTSLDRVAEWLCDGLQSQIRWFNSTLGLQIRIGKPTAGDGSGLENRRASEGALGVRSSPYPPDGGNSLKNPRRGRPRANNPGVGRRSKMAARTLGQIRDIRERSEVSKRCAELALLDVVTSGLTSTKCG